MIERQAVIDCLSHKINVEFQAQEPRSYPVPKERVKWFLWPNNYLMSRRKPSVHVVWSDFEDVIHIETDWLGNTMDMIEWIYGTVPKEFALMDMTGFEKKEQVWEEAKLNFLPVINRLLRYEKEISQISEQQAVPLELIYHGGKGLASFRIEGRIATVQFEPMFLPRFIDKAVTALDKAYIAIRMQQQRLADAWGYLPGLPYS